MSWLSRGPRDQGPGAKSGATAHRWGLKENLPLSCELPPPPQEHHTRDTSDTSRVCWGGFPPPTNSATPAGGPPIQLSSDAIHQDTASDPRGQRPSPSRPPPSQTQPQGQPVTGPLAAVNRGSHNLSREGLSNFPGQLTDLRKVHRRDYWVFTKNASREEPDGRDLPADTPSFSPFLTKPAEASSPRRAKPFPSWSQAPRLPGTLACCPLTSCLALQGKPVRTLLCIPRGRPTIFSCSPSPCFTFVLTAVYTTRQGLRGFPLPSAVLLPPRPGLESEQSRCSGHVPCLCCTREAVLRAHVTFSASWALPTAPWPRGLPSDIGGSCRWPPFSSRHTSLLPGPLSGPICCFSLPPAPSCVRGLCPS